MAWSIRSVPFALLTVLVVSACDEAGAKDDGSAPAETDSGGEDSSDGGEGSGEDCYDFATACENPDLYCVEEGRDTCIERCAEGSGLWQDVALTCMPASCEADEIFRAADEPCIDGPGIECHNPSWGGHGLWRCERCAEGWERDEDASTDDAVACVEIEDPNARCIELMWECYTDDRVCVPGQNACALCADLGEDPNDFEGHCCDGLVQNADRTACIEAPPADSCIPNGGICGHSGVTIQCCEGTVCSDETDLCEPVE